MIYEIINPSDAVTIDAPTFEAAALATILLGNGAYAADPRGHDGEKVPLFLFGGWRCWIAERFGYAEAEAMLEAHRADVIAALRSTCTGSVTDRQLFDHALSAITDPDKRAAFIADWDDKRRSSMNQISNRAHALADAYSRDTDGSPKGGDGEAGSVRSTTAGAEGIAQNGGAA